MFLRILTWLPVFLLLAVYAPAQKASSLVDASDAVYASDPDSSFVLSRKAELLAAQAHDTTEWARALSRNARYLLLKSRFEESGEALNKSIALAEVKNDTKTLAYAYKLKAIFTKRIGNLQEAIGYEEKAASLYSALSDTTGKCNVLLNLSLDYIDLKDFARGKAALDSIARYPAVLESSLGYFYHQNYGKLYASEGKYSLALEEYGIARPIAEKTKMLDSYVTLLSLIAEAQMNAGDLGKAEASLLESCRLARENKFDNELDESLVILTELYTRKGDYKKAFATQKEQAALNQSIYNLERINKINELEKQLQLSQKEKELAQKDLDLEKEKTETARLGTQIFILVISGFSVFVILVLIAVLLFRTRKLNRRIEGQKKLIEEKSAIIEDAYKSITDSIAYSKRIQGAMLPEKQFVASLFPQSFILYKPKDIVSGDFYWVEKKGNEILFAVVDCTGHGVPGAFMSIVGFNLLNEAVQVRGLRNPGAILDSLSAGISATLKQDEQAGEDPFSPAQVRDGMDIALCSWNAESRRLRYAGAWNPAWILRGGNIIELTADKQPIGAYQGQLAKPFTEKETVLEPGDCLYLFSDGYADQFGGEKGKKFKTSRLRELLQSVAQKPMEEQNEILESTHQNWRGNLVQVDDILVMGIRF